MLLKSAVVQHLLLSLGVTPNYKGFHYIVHSVLISLEENECLQQVTKMLYPKVAKHYNTTWSAVERNIRTVITLIWERNPAALQELADFTMTRKPTVGQFIAILTIHVAAFPVNHYWMIDRS